MQRGVHLGKAKAGPDHGLETALGDMARAFEDALKRFG